LVGTATCVVVGIAVVVVVMGLRLPPSALIVQVPDVGGVQRTWPTPTRLMRTVSCSVSWP
jgi:hypothetical protein